MNRIVRLVGISSAVILASCALSSGSPKFVEGYPDCSGDKQYCNATECYISVKVQACGKPSASGNYGMITVRDDFHVCAQRRIVWSLDDRSYKFLSDGIVFKSYSPTFTRPDHSDSQFVWLNLHSDTLPHDYAVTVADQDGNPCARIDPRISNE